MKRLFFIALAGVAGLPSARAQGRVASAIPATGRTLADFIPAHYDTLSTSLATGDLNRDGRPDVAVVLRHTAETTVDYPDDALPARRLLVLFGTPTGYTLAAQSSRAVLCKGCGGVFGDPFAGLTIYKGVLSVDHYGGSSWRWSITAKFRYQQGGFYLIGETHNYGRNDGDCPGLDGSAGSEYKDTNFVTGAYEVKKISDTCKLLVNKRGRNQPAPLRKLAEYVVVP